MPNCVHRVMNWMKTAESQPPVDRLLRETTTPELIQIHDSLGAGGEPGHRQITPRVGIHPHIECFSTLGTQGSVALGHTAQGDRAGVTDQYAVVPRALRVSYREMAPWSHEMPRGRRHSPGCPFESASHHTYARSGHRH